MFPWAGCMHTRSKGPPLEPIDLEIEASKRKRNAQWRLNQRIRVSSPGHRHLPSPAQRTPSHSPSPRPSLIQYEPRSPILMADEENNNFEDNEENNNNENPVIRQLLEQMANMQKHMHLVEQVRKMLTST